MYKNWPKFLFTRHTGMSSFTPASVTGSLFWERGFVCLHTPPGCVREARAHHRSGWTGQGNQHSGLRSTGLPDCTFNDMSLMWNRHSVLAFHSGQSPW